MSLLQFLADLSKDPAKRDRFAKNPDDVLKDERDLPADVKAVLKTRDSSQIKAKLGEEAEAIVIWAKQE